MEYKAVYFDRDGTLSRQDPEIIAERDHRISEIVGREIVVDEVLNRAAFVAVWDEHPELEPVRDMQTEDAFWQQWFAMLLTKLGVTQGVTEHAKRLFQQYPFYKIMTPFPESWKVRSNSINTAAQKHDQLSLRRRTRKCIKPVSTETT